MSSDCEMLSDHEMIDPRDIYGSDSDDESINDEEYEYTVTFKIPLKALSIVNSRIDEVIDKLIYEELLKQEDVGITINRL